jgi:hypothetical protein
MNEFGSHSAVVEMWLDCGHFGTVRLERITPKSVVAKEPCNIPPCEADLVVVVDGHPTRHRVMLTSGFSGGRLAARVQPVTDAVPF